MQRILTAAQMKACDTYTIEKVGIPSAVLMERAALCAADEAERMYRDGGKNGIILVLAGSGNNGGDGYACGRILSLRGISVRILEAGNPDHMSEETVRQREICKRTGVTLIPAGDSGGDDEAFERAFHDVCLIIDALFGIGLAREITGRYERVIRQAEACDAPVLAIDIPSGIHADTGAVMGCALKADVTVTMQSVKPGHLLYPGAAYTGRLVCADIGVIVPRTDSADTACVIEKQDLPEMLPERDPSGNKGTFGKVLLVAGSRGMAGAAVLAAKASLRLGCGMVKILTEECNRIILQELLPEALISTWKTEEEAEELLIKELGWCTVCAAGPGIGKTNASRRMINKLLEEKRNVPLVLDADAINILSEKPEILYNYKGTAFITPHIVEMSRLTGKDPGEIKANPIAAAGRFTHETGISCVLKDARTVTACPEGGIYINTTGNDGMATAGSGDVLTGILASLLAQGAARETAGALAAFLHGYAGDLAAERLGRRYMCASDLTESLSDCLL